MTDDQIPEQPPASPAEGRPALTRSSRHRVVAGVCGGLGRYLDIDPVVFRVVIAVLGLTGGLGLFLYGLAWLVVPREAEDGEGGRTELQRVLTGRVDGQSVGAVLVTAIGTGVFFSSMGDGGQLFPLLLLAVLVFLALRYDPERRRRFDSGEAPPAGPSGPRDRLEETGPFADWKTWSEAVGRDLRVEWQARSTELQDRMRSWQQEHSAGGATEERPADTPPVGPSGYLWDPRHPERNPYGGATPPPGAAARPWWQRTDLPAGDPLRKEPRAEHPGDPEDPEDRGDRGETHRERLERRTADFRARADQRHRAQREAMERHRASMERHREWKARRKAERGSSVLGASAVLVAVGASWAVAASDHGQHRWSTVLAVALLPLGLAMLVGSRWGRTRGLTFLSLLLTAGLVAAAGTSATVADSTGDRAWHVGAGELRPRYTLGLGDARLDLSALDPQGGTLSTELRVGAGEARVTVPSGVELRMKLRDGAGTVRLPDGQSFEGPFTNEDVVIEVPDGQPSRGVLELTVAVGAGDIEVVR
ncbi:PspC domain-containing protein [Kitasatospora sp. NA04385]|uniref:PspC domain-containing protein n=1 Tax=Kitasatospora sp. NA04385 TaxID=2742135 RepID=UPI001590A80B|nr:PspC domain-containing protein [Kitasatospora sp. NA04385]QKW19929.1 PspC domain-containing protein [Kitasatospora sp. NA04385]